jgi:3-oxoacyl-[acyl-carrier-protein] synthase II
MRRVVVTGIGALTPLGKNLHEYWEGLKDGVSGCDLITRFDTEKFKTKFACEVKGYDSGNYFDRKEANKLDFYSQFAHIASDEAIKDSGINLERIDKDRVGVIWASGI